MTTRSQLPLAAAALAAFLIGGCGRAPAPGGPTILSDAEFTKKYEAPTPLRAFNEPPSNLECNPKPTQDEINSAQGVYQDYYMSAKRAASIGIPIVNASGQ